MLILAHLRMTEGCFFPELEMTIMWTRQKKKMLPIYVSAMTKFKSRKKKTLLICGVICTSYYL